MNERARIAKRIFRIGIGIAVVSLLLITSTAMARTATSTPASANTSLQQGNGSLRVVVFNDLNENEVRDNGEQGVPNVDVEVLSVDEGQSASPETGTTDSDGTVEFDLPPGNYRVTISLSEQSYSTIAGSDRLATVLANLRTEVNFPVIQVGTQATATIESTSPAGQTPTTAPTFTPTLTPSPTNTPRPTNTRLPTNTPSGSPTATGTVGATATNTATPTETASPTPTGTLFPITPILITTTPGVFVTTTPVPGAAGRLPDTGVGSDALLWAVGFGALMLMAAGLRRFFRRETG